MTALAKIEGIGNTYAAKLKAAGVRSVEALLKQGASRKGRQALATASGIGDGSILEWVNQADLFRIKGIGEEYSDLLEKAGVDSVPEPSQRKAENLFSKIVEVNSAQKLVRKLPTDTQVANWVKQAKALRRIVEY